MRKRLALLIALFVLATVALACSGGNDRDPSESVTPGQETPTVDGSIPTLSPGGGAEPTPTDLAEARERLSSQLDAIGANIGAVPEDVRRQIMERCHALEQFADADEVGQICDTIEQAIDSGDPGLIDRILSQLAALDEG